MVLRIFIKRKTGGELCTKNYEHFEQLIEAPEILKSEIDPKLNSKGFKFTVKNFDGSEVREAYCPTDTHGFEIYDSRGTTISRYISKTETQVI